MDSIQSARLWWSDAAAGEKGHCLPSSQSNQRVCGGKSVRSPWPDPNPSESLPAKPCVLNPCGLSRTFSVARFCFRLIVVESGSSSAEHQQTSATRRLQRACRMICMLFAVCPYRFHFVILSVRIICFCLFDQREYAVLRIAVRAAPICGSLPCRASPDTSGDTPRPSRRFLPGRPTSRSAWESGLPPSTLRSSSPPRSSAPPSDRRSRCDTACRSPAPAG